jgi:hypothetical protein
MTPQENIEAFNAVCGLLDAACARLQPVIAAENTPESTKSYLMSIWRDITCQRNMVAEVQRATRELVDE